jgi:transcriptional regulator with GAF, ATPase, and Fis domain
MLWSAMQSSRGNVIDSVPVRQSTGVRRTIRRGTPERTTVIRALHDTEGRRTAATDVLGLQNRYALDRLMKKYEIESGGYRGFVGGAGA